MLKRRFDVIPYDIVQGDVHPELPRAGEYHRSSLMEGSMSYEEAALVYGLTMAVKPRMVLELGTETGFSTVHVALALKDAGCGNLIGVDVDPSAVAKTNKLLMMAGVVERAEIICQDSLQYVASSDIKFDMVLIDTIIGRRIMELDAVVAKMVPKTGMTVFIHDTSPLHPMNGVQGYPKIDLAVELRKRNIDFCYVPSPRGAIVARVEERK